VTLQVKLDDALSNHLLMHCPAPLKGLSNSPHFSDSVTHIIEVGYPEMFQNGSDAFHLAVNQTLNDLFNKH